MISDRSRSPVLCPLSRWYLSTHQHFDLKSLSLITGAMEMPFDPAFWLLFASDPPVVSSLFPLVDSSSFSWWIWHPFCQNVAYWRNLPQSCGYVFLVGVSSPHCLAPWPALSPAPLASLICVGWKQEIWWIQNQKKDLGDGFATLDVCGNLCWTGAGD